MLTESAIRNAKRGAKPRRLYDNAGLYLEVSPAGGKLWRLKYRHAGKEKRLALGVYPDVSLKQARERRDDARKQIASGRDPAAERKAAKQETDPESFETVAREWFGKFSLHWAVSHSDKIIRRLERDLFPYLGSRSIKSITAPELLTVLRRIEARGTSETAHRALQNCGQIFRYAVATGRAERNPAGDLRGALAPTQETHYPSITEPKAVGELLRALDGYQGDLITRSALKLAPLVFVRPGELRRAEWVEIDLDKAEWRIPAEKMKARAPHVVPLSRQAVAILKELHPLTGGGRYVFPGLRSLSRPMSENTVNAALRRLGYDQHTLTGHGFRSMASTLLNEQGWNRDAIERQLAHGERDAVRAAYNYAEHLPVRRKMMQSWADYLDGLRVGGKVVPIKRKA
jgi:integrase